MQDFILEIPDFLSLSECNFYLDLFKSLEKSGFVEQRGVVDPHVSPHVIDDSNTALNNIACMKVINGDNIFLHKFWSTAYANYAQKFSILKDASNHGIYSLKMQRTRPGEGYHLWHHETDKRSLMDRLLTFICYLDDVKEGGETEFLYLKKRIKPQAGKLILFPGAFTHAHRGNQPLSGDKHILTGWVEYT